MIDVFSKDGCEMVDILFDRFLKKYYADIDVSNERMTINLTDEEGHADRRGSAEENRGLLYQQPGGV